MAKETVLGVDGCRAGWLAIALKEDHWTAEIFHRLEMIWQAYSGAALILLDMPIGLPASGAARACDRAARRLLGSRGASVFSPPCRPAAYASSYEEASKLNFGLTGKKISKQTWFITPKIREADQLLRAEPLARTRMLEAHPEVAFAVLAGAPLQHSKKKEAGFQERMKILNPFFPAAEEIVVDLLQRYLRREVARDDIVDALCLAVHARLKLEYGLGRLPYDPPPTDGEGLPMQIVYALPGEELPFFSQ